MRTARPWLILISLTAGCASVERSTTWTALNAPWLRLGARVETPEQEAAVQLAWRQLLEPPAGVGPSWTWTASRCSWR